MLMQCVVVSFSFVCVQSSCSDAVRCWVPAGLLACLVMLQIVTSILVAFCCFLFLRACFATSFVASDTVSKCSICIVRALPFHLQCFSEEHRNIIRSEPRDRNRDTETEESRDIRTERQANRKTEEQRDRRTERHQDRETGNRETEGQRDRRTERQ